MSKTQSSTAVGSGKGALARQRINVNMMQNILLIWFDESIDDNSTDCPNMIAQLQHVVNTINTFTDLDECIDFLTDISSEKVFMIISGTLCENIVPLIHDVTQLHTIFIFCAKKTIYEQWANKWSIIKGVFTEISPICESIKQSMQQYEQNTIPISFIMTTGDASSKNLDQLDPSFMYTQILKEILLTIQFQQKHIKEFTAFCRAVLADNEGTLNKVNKFEREYHNKTPIWWYTSDYFLYPILNRALRLMDVNIIINMGFFIRDLHRHIEQLHSEQFNGHYSSNSFTVYRGQGMSKTDFDQLMKTKGGLISFNNFLSTSKNRDVSLFFAESNQNNSDIVMILFIMTIDPSISSTPFASIDDIGYYEDAEAEVLFSMHTVFRIRDIKPMDENSHRLFQVDLTLTSDNDEDLRVLTDRIREETFPNLEGWYRLGQLLLTMGQSEKVQQVCEVILEQTTDESKKASIYHQIGWAKDNQGEYKEAITFYEKALEIDQKTLPPNHPDLAISYNNIGAVYYNMGEYSEALSHYKKALEIQQKTLPPNHPDLASSYNNISNVYDNMGENSKAFSCKEKALEIRQKSLPPNHPDLAMSYNNIGEAYCDMGEYSKALSYYEKSLEISQKSLPPNHPDLAKSYIAHGLVYYNMGEYPKAIMFYEKALEIQQKSLPSNHPDLAKSYSNIGIVYDNMGEYSKALSSHEKTLEISQKSLPPNHPDFSSFYNNIGMVYDKMGEYLKALSYYEKSFEIDQKTLSPNHPDFTSSYGNIGNVYCNMGEYSKALSYYEKALEIKQKSFPPNHPDLGGAYNNIGVVCEYMGNYSKALSFYERAADIGKHSLPSNHPNLQMYRENIEDVKKKF